MPTRWVGIDEAGYGPNLGPLVMTAVVVETVDDRPPDVWGDLAAHVGRAGSDPGLVWVDDSKALYKPGCGRDRLDAACLALVTAADPAGVVPGSFGHLLRVVSAGSLDDVEVSRWLDAGDPSIPRAASRERVDQALARGPFAGAPWRVVDVRAEVVGPARFNEGLARTSSKARVHFEAFARLLHAVWPADGTVAVTSVRSDKHGGRHFYYEPLVEIFPNAWVDRGPEGPALSRYTVRRDGRSLGLSLQPRADAADGLVALASVVSKAVREHWMDAFNAFWAARVPGLKPTAGYPLDARRFLEAVRPYCEGRGDDVSAWWRLK